MIEGINLITRTEKLLAGNTFFNPDTIKNTVCKSTKYYHHPNIDGPDMVFNYSILANHLTMEIFKQYYNVKTTSGFTMQKCIQPGFDNTGNPSNFSLGVVAGGEESYETFQDLLNKIIEELHDGYKATNIGIGSQSEV